MSVHVRRIEAGDIDSFHKCLDSVAREGIYIAKDKAPDIERIRTFIENNISNDVSQYVAIENGMVVGWCDAMSSQTKSLLPSQQSSLHNMRIHVIFGYG